MIVSALSAAYKVQERTRVKAQAKEIAAQVFEQLADYGAEIANDSSDADGYLSVNQLRDDVLRAEFSTAHRRKVWKEVESIVEQNTNVRARLGALDSGDVGRGWKWIGALRAIEQDGANGASGGSRRTSKRFSMRALDSSPMTEVDRSLAGAHGTPGSGKHTFTRWEDTNRPQY